MVGELLAKVEVMVVTEVVVMEVVTEVVEMVVMVEEDQGESKLEVELFMVLGKGQSF